MTKRIVLLFDGTWSNRRTGTNVARLHESLHTSAEQPCFYDPGVGTRWHNWLTGGAFGRGLSENIQQGYEWLCRRHDPGDGIYTFGFSRGAYTARSLVGLIRKCGLLNTVSRKAVTAAYELYRDKSIHPDAEAAVAFRGRNSREVRVTFVGVWDTVGSLGIPMSQVPFSRDYYQWHDTELSKIVDYAYHAVATDEHRLDFDVTSWTRRKPENVEVEQRWFPGSHSDVGGGEGGALPNLSLRWLQDRSEAVGLAYRKKAAVGHDDALAPIDDSYGGFLLGAYRLFRRRHDRHFGKGVAEVVDESVWRRWRADPRYRPPSLLRHPGRPPDPTPPMDRLTPQPVP